MIQIPAWHAYDWLRHGFSERRGGASTVYGAACAADGELNLGFTAEDDLERVRRNRATAVRLLAGETSAQLVTGRQVHGTGIRALRADEICTQPPEGLGVREGDGLITSVAGLLLGVQAADCVPVLVADTRLRVVAAFHAGWRGTAAGMVEQGIARMHTEFGSAPEDLTAAVGPAIGVCCYAVGEEVETRFREAFPYAGSLFEQHAEATHLDLAEANRRQLLAAGLSAERIFLTGQCTACTLLEGRRRFFSHRAEHGHTGRGMGLIGIFPGIGPSSTINRQPDEAPGQERFSY